MPYIPVSRVLLICFSSVTLIMLFYYLYFFLRLALRRTRAEAKPDEAQRRPISLVICAFNEEANLTKNLPLWLKQDYLRNGKPCFEVLVINHNSEDDTFYLLNRMCEEYPHLRVVHLTQEAKLIPGKKFPLSMGIKSAYYEHVLLTDADCTPDSDQWLARMTSGFSDTTQVVLGYSPYKRHKGWLNRRIRFETVHTAMQYLSYALAGTPYMGVGRNLAYTRTLFFNNKGFSSHNHIASGDDDLFINQVANKKNTVIRIHPEAFTRSEPKKTGEHWFYQKARHLSTGKYYRFKHRLLLGGYAFSHFFFWALFIALLFFPALYPITGGIWLSRALLHFILFRACFRKLDGADLVPWIPIFDLYFIYYNISHLGTIFFKTPKHWK
jgi:cellulose synthase/poly-beta-1,6-N-acetylglucosamine synthase-like glycosyltransferase